MGPQKLCDVGVEGVVGEVVLSGHREQRDLTVDDARIEGDDAVACAGRPPSAQPVPECQPAQCLKRLRQWFGGNLDRVGSSRGVEGCEKIDVSVLPEHTPQPLRLGWVDERHGDGFRRVVDGPGQHRTADFEHRGSRAGGHGGSGSPQPGVPGELHGVTRSSASLASCSIALMRCRWSRLTERATPSSTARMSSTSAHDSCQTSRPWSRAQSLLM